MPAGSTEIDDDSIGNNNGVCELNEACTLQISYLENTYEIMGDEKGNDNNLCETGEACIYTPNVGSYQGHGALELMSDADGYTIMKYNANGY